MITSPTIDIIVPVWNNLFETRACLVAILAHSSGARLIIVDNGSSRETELMLEEFSESLGERGLFIKSEKNIGLVAAINLGLARSDSDYAVIVRPNVTVHGRWLETLVDAAQTTGAGLVSPLFSGDGAPPLPQLVPGISIMESCTVSFETLLIRAEMRMIAGSFNDQLDGGEWCLREYVRRVAARGYRTCITGQSRLSCSTSQLFGSVQRRTEMEQSSQSTYLSAWGISRHYCVYFGVETDAGSLADCIATLLDGARQGHRFMLILHRRQFSAFCKMGWNGLHTGIELNPLPLLFPHRSFQRVMTALINKTPDLVAVRGCSGVAFPGMEAALPFDELQHSIAAHTTTVSASSREACS